VGVISCHGYTNQKRRKEKDTYNLAEKLLGAEAIRLIRRFIFVKPKSYQHVLSLWNVRTEEE